MHGIEKVIKILALDYLKKIKPLHSPDWATDS